MQTVVADNNNKVVVFHGGKQYDLSDREQRIQFGIEKWRPHIRRQAHRLKNTVTDTDDLWQEAVMSVIRAADSWSPDGASFETFCFKCINNGMRDASIRGKFPLSVPSGSIGVIDKEVLSELSTSRTIHDDIPDIHAEDPFEEYDIKELIAHFDQDDIGQMYFVERRTYQEISEITGISRAAVGRAVVRLKEVMRKQFE